MTTLLDIKYIHTYMSRSLKQLPSVTRVQQSV